MTMYKVLLKIKMDIFGLVLIMAYLNGIAKGVKTYTVYHREIVISKIISLAVIVLPIAVRKTMHSCYLMADWLLLPIMVLPYSIHKTSMKQNPNMLCPLQI